MPIVLYFLAYLQPGFPSCTLFASTLGEESLRFVGCIALIAVSGCVQAVALIVPFWTRTAVPRLVQWIVQGQSQKRGLRLGRLQTAH